MTPERERHGYEPIELNKGQAEYFDEVEPSTWVGFLRSNRTRNVVIRGVKLEPHAREYARRELGAKTIEAVMVIVVCKGESVNQCRRRVVAGEGFNS